MNIILSPHFDDAVLSLGGLLAQEGSDTLVATFFTSTPQTPLIRKWDTMCGFADSDQAMRERTEENRRALDFFGVTDDRIRNYPHLDAQYRLVRGAPVPPEPELDASIEKEISALLEESATEPVKVFIPGFGMHDDHAVVKRAALAAAQSLPAEHTIAFFFYQELPYAGEILGNTYSRSLKDFLMGKKPEPFNSALLEHAITQGAYPVSPGIIPLTRANMEKKLAGIACYASQVTHLGGGHLLKKIKRFSAAQARHLALSVPYCEVVYGLTRQSRS